MAIKKPSINRPGMVKPNTGIKKPSGLAKPVVEEPKQEIIEEPIQEIQAVQEESVEIEIPEDVVVQIEEDKEIAKIIEERDKEDDGTRYSLEEAKEAVKEKLEEEVQKEAIVEEKQEEPAPKKKSSRKKSSNKKAKEEVKKEEVAEVAEEEIKDYKAKSLSNAWNEMISLTECTTPEWEERKAAIKEQVEAMHIDPDSTPAEMRYLIADIDAALSQLKIYKIETDQVCNSLLKQINYVSLQAGSKGANSEERKANAIKGLIFYKKNPGDDLEDYINLLELQTYAENQIAFYDEMIKILVDKKNMLITFSGIVKTESQLGSY